VTKLDPEFKAKWIAALRSGEYPPGQGCLFMKMPGKQEGYCCLGVGAHVAGVLEVRLTSSGRYQGSVFAESEGVQYPQSAYWHGPNDELKAKPSAEMCNDATAYLLLADRPGVDIDGLMITSLLADLNDKRVPHAQLADLIEKHL